MMLLPSGSSRARVVTLGLRMAVAVAALFAPLTAQAESNETNYNGHYELADGKGNRSFSLEIIQTGSRAKISFSAAMADGSGAAPDGSGKGRVEDGVLSFKFKDSFKNEGTCILQPAKSGYHLSMTVTKVVEPRPFHFYGTVLLQKISSTPKAM